MGEQDSVIIIMGLSMFTSGAVALARSMRFVLADVPCHLIIG